MSSLHDSLRPVGGITEIGGRSMIGSLTGTLSEIETDGDSGVQLVVDVQGVGYRVIVTPRLGGSLGGVGSAVGLSIHTHVREAAITLYGFSDSAERRSFELLLGAHGVGPSLALSIMSAFHPATLANAIVNGDVEALMEVPGVGRKTAQRLILDLAQRFEGSLGVVTTPANEANDAKELVRSEARAALTALGYGPAEIRHAFESVDEDGSVQELIRAALRELAPVAR